MVTSTVWTSAGVWLREVEIDKVIGNANALLFSNLTIIFGTCFSGSITYDVVICLLTLFFLLSVIRSAFSLPYGVKTVVSGVYWVLHRYMNYRAHAAFLYDPSCSFAFFSGSREVFFSHRGVKLKRVRRTFKPCN